MKKWQTPTSPPSRLIFAQRWHRSGPFWEFEDLISPAAGRCTAYETRLLCYKLVSPKHTGTRLFRPYPEPTTHGNKAVHGTSALVLHLLRNPEDLIAQAIATGYPLLVMMGIILPKRARWCFPLPGDSLLVTAGVFAANPKYGLSLLQMNVALSVMAVLGDALSYFIGRRTGPALFSRPKSRLFNPDHIRQAHAFTKNTAAKRSSSRALCRFCAPSFPLLRASAK